MKNPPPIDPARAVYRIRRRDDAPKQMRRLFTAIVVAVAAVAGLDVAVDPTASVERSVLTVDAGQTPSPVTEAGEVGAAAAGDASILPDDREARPDDDATVEPEAATGEQVAAEPSPAEASSGDDVPTASGESPNTDHDPPPPETPAPEPEPEPEPAPADVVPDPNPSFDEATAHLDPGGSDPYARALAAYETAVPEVWRIAVPINLEMRAGSTSLSYPSGTVTVGTRQMDTWRHALYVLAHEWAHQAAYRFGTGNYLGAPPDGFPGKSILLRAEQFAECVAQSLVGYRWANPYPPCSDAAMAWTADWLANGPPTR